MSDKRLVWCQSRAGYCNRDIHAAELEALRKENERLRETATKLRRQITIKDRALHEKNVALDAMGWVWCDGGCPGGAGRYTPVCLTESVVAAAERNTARLRQWLENAAFRAKWAAMSPQERDEWMRARAALQGEKG